MPKQQSEAEKVVAAVRKNLSIEELVDGVLSGRRDVLARAITLVESSNNEHRTLAKDLLNRLLPHSGKSIRVGISGVPGVGKSTFIEALGMHLVRDAHKVAVLAIDPSSSRSGGSILGDKTRMQQLSAEANAYIRPSPTAGALGGVTRMTRETMLLCEAAGFDTILVETVGVGQSEISVAAMVDFYLVLMLPGAGDELQGIKKGVLEIADMLAVNKADPGADTIAQNAATAYQRALHIMSPQSPNWTPPVMTCSALHQIGLQEIWSQVLNFKNKLGATGEFEEKRTRQKIDWLWSLIEQQLMQDIRQHPALTDALKHAQAQVADGELTAGAAADEVIEQYQRL